MNSHEELDRQFQVAVELDNVRDDRINHLLTLGEQLQGIEAVSKWPKKDREELLMMEENERNIILLLAGSLGAVPESETAPE